MFFSIIDLQDFLYNMDRRPLSGIRALFRLLFLSFTGLLMTKVLNLSVMEHIITFLLCYKVLYRLTNIFPLQDKGDILLYCPMGASLFYFSHLDLKSNAHVESRDRVSFCSHLSIKLTSNIY